MTVVARHFRARDGTDLLSLPSGDPEEGHVHPTKDETASTGTSPQEEQDWLDSFLTAQLADLDRVLQAEDAIVRQRVADAEQYATEVHLSSVIPSEAQAGSGDLEINVFGQHFDGTTVAQLGGMALETTLVSDTQVKAILPVPVGYGSYVIRVFACTDEVPFGVTL